MQSEISLWASVLAEIAHQSRGTNTVSVVLPTRRTIFTSARLLTILTVLSIGTRLCAPQSGPSRRTIALSSHVGTLAVMLTITLERTVRAKPSLTTRMLTSGTRVTGSTLQRPRDMMTRLRVILLLPLTLVLAVQTKESLGTGSVALFAQPTGRTLTISSRLIAGRVVLAEAFRVTFWAVESNGTLRVASDT